MPETMVYNIKMHKLGANGEDIILYPQTLDTNIIIDPNNPAIPSTVTSLTDLVASMGGLAFEDSVATNVSTGDDYAVLRVTDSTTEDDSDMVASAKAVATVDANAVKLTVDQEVDGVKAFTNGINIGGVMETESSAAPVVNGYYNSSDGKFYEESTFVTEITPEIGKTYKDITSDVSYSWDGTEYTTGAAVIETSAITGGVDVSFNESTNTIIFS